MIIELGINSRAFDPSNHVNALNPIIISTHHAILSVSITNS